MKSPIFAAAIAALLTACGAEQAPDTPDSQTFADAVEEVNAAPATVGEPVTFELADLDGQARSSTEWDGKPKLVNFWATWCAPCRREIPLLKDTQDKYTDIDLQVIGIAVDFAEDVAAYAAEAEFNYPILVGQEDAMAVAETSGVAFIGLPFTMVVAPSGELIKNHIGEIEEEHITQIAATFTALQSGEIDIAQAREQLGVL